MIVIWGGREMEENLFKLDHNESSMCVKLIGLHLRTWMEYNRSNDKKWFFKFYIDSYSNQTKTIFVEVVLDNAYVSIACLTIYVATKSDLLCIEVHHL